VIWDKRVAGNILSMYNQNCIWTDLYFDEFASLPPIIPEGPIAILGLVCFSSALHSSILFGC
jgi:hypothetical protein